MLKTHQFCSLNCLKHPWVISHPLFLWRGSRSQSISLTLHSSPWSLAPLFMELTSIHHVFLRKSSRATIFRLSTHSSMLPQSGTMAIFVEDEGIFFTIIVIHFSNSKTLYYSELSSKLLSCIFHYSFHSEFKVYLRNISNVNYNSKYFLNNVFKVQANNCIVLSLTSCKESLTQQSQNTSQLTYYFEDTKLFWSLKLFSAAFMQENNNYLYKRKHFIWIFF